MNTVDKTAVDTRKTEFSTAVANALNSSGASKKDLAETIGVSVNTIRNILKGENFNFKVAIMLDIALDLNFFTSDTSKTWEKLAPDSVKTLEELLSAE